MKPDLVAALEEWFAKWPGIRGSAVPLDEVVAAEEVLGVELPLDYRDFIVRYGGGVVGPYPVFGLRRAEGVMSEDLYTVTENTAHFRRQLPGDMQTLVVVSMDHGGNPIGFLAGSPQIVTWDHDFGGLHVEAASFSDWLGALLAAAE